MPALRSASRFWILLFALCAIPFNAAKSGEPPPPGMSVHGPNTPATVLPATATEVEIEVAGMVAHARVRQRFINPGNDFLEGQYRLPMPADSAVYAMRIELDGRLIEGEIREREAARVEYEAAKSAGMATALVERQAADMFSTRVANIPPQSEVNVEIEYFQNIGYRDGRFELVFPLTLRPRYGSTPVDDLGAALDAAAPAATSTGITLPARIDVRVAAGIPILAPQSASHSIAVSGKNKDFRIHTRSERIAADRDFVLSWAPLPGAAAQAAGFVEEIDGKRYVSLMLVPPTQTGPRLSRELILVLDSSGSMMGAAWNGAQKAADFALTQLRPGDYFNVVDFDSSATALSPMSLPMNAQAIATARDFVATRTADGGTEIAGAIDTALSLPPINGLVRQVVFITDGAVGNEDEIYRQIAARGSDARLFMVGIGNAPNRAFLRRSAELGRGFAEIIESIDAIDKPLSAMFRRIDAPVLTGIDVQWPGDAEAWPKAFPDLYSGEPLWLTSRIDGGPGEVKLRAQGQTGIFSKSLSTAQATPAVGIAKIWARRKIQALEDDLTLGADEATVRAEVLRTALEHRLLSRFTSFVAVEKVVRRKEGDALAKTEFNNPPPADAEFAQTALGWRAQLLLGLMLIGLAMIVWLRSRPQLANAATGDAEFSGNALGWRGQLLLGVFLITVFAFVLVRGRA
jgi:Ca-activated chloride channel homolog